MQDVTIPDVEHVGFPLGVEDVVFFCFETSAKYICT